MISSRKHEQKHALSMIDSHDDDAYDEGKFVF